MKILKADININLGKDKASRPVAKSDPLPAGVTSRLDQTKPIGPHKKGCATNTLCGMFGGYK